MLLGAQHARHDGAGVQSHAAAEVRDARRLARALEAVREAERKVRGARRVVLVRVRAAAAGHVAVADGLHLEHAQRLRERIELAEHSLKHAEHLRRRHRRAPLREPNLRGRDAGRVSA